MIDTSLQIGAGNFTQGCSRPGVPAGTALEAGQGDDARLQGMCRDFEAMLYRYMLDAMRKTIDKGELFDGGQAEQLYTSMLDQEYAGLISRGTQRGLGEVLYQQLRSRDALQQYQTIETHTGGMLRAGSSDRTLRVTAD